MSLRHRNGQVLSKAERLEQMTDPYGPDFPLDEDIVTALEPYPGELPRDPQHYVDLLPWPEPTPQQALMQQLGGEPPPE